jgi:hypothetical protein
MSSMSPIGNASSAPNSLVAPLWSGALAVPGLAAGVAIAHEQDVFSLRATRDQDGDRIGLGKPGQVMEVAVGSVEVVHVAVALLLDAVGRMTMPPLPIMRMSWRRRRENSSLRRTMVHSLA